MFIVAPDAIRCPYCGLFTHKWDQIGDLTARITADWSVTEEGVQIVSGRFKVALEDAGAEGVSYKPLSNGGYMFRPKRAVYIDMSECFQENQNYCRGCGRFEASLGYAGDGVLLSGQKKIEPLEIVRSIQYFGSSNFFVEECIFGDDIANFMMKKRWRGGINWEDFPQN